MEGLEGNGCLCPVVFSSNTLLRIEDYRRVAAVLYVEWVNNSVT